ncbi:MAG: HAD family hydrolase [Clostridia bacterium]|nr:HAD family hydrolase [Clostridia bacterium]
MVKLCVFDLDGTVLDTVGSIAYYGNYALQKNGIEPIDPPEYKYLAGTGIANLIRKMLEFRHCYSESLYERVYHDYDTAYNADVSYKSRIFDGLKEALDAIKAQGVRLAIASNKPDFAAKTVVNKLYGEGYFAYVTGQVPGGVLKPDPTVVLNVVEQMGVRREECLYIGDTSTDMQTGKNAGIFTVGVLWGFRGKDELVENGADWIVAKPCELFELVTDRNRREMQ